MELTENHYWWHKKLLDEVERLDSLGELPYPAKGIAGNLGFTETDTLAYAIQLGLDTNATPRWDYPRRWIGRAA